MPLRLLRFPLIVALACAVACRASPTPVARDARSPDDAHRLLPTGVALDPAGASIPVGQMPLAMVLSPDGARIVLLLSGWREQGIQVVDRATRRVVQTFTQPSAFVGLAFAPNGQSLLVSGADGDLVYRYDWRADTAVLADSIALGPHPRRGQQGSRYPAGLALSPNGNMLYVAENLDDSLAVVDVAAKRVVQRLPAGRYPYGVLVGRDGTVYVSAWGANTVHAFTPSTNGSLREAGAITVARHPSAMVANRDGTRLFVASATTDRVSVVDTRRRTEIAQLLDPPPAGPAEGATPNALALSTNGTRLFAAEADANAVAVFDLSTRSAGVTAPGRDTLAGRIPVEWYPSAILVSGDTMLVANGKGRGTAPNPTGPTPARGSRSDSRAYTLGQLTGTLSTITGAGASREALAPLTARVSRANRWDQPARAAAHYPPFEHVIYVIKENRTYDQVLGDLSAADGDTALLFFPRAVSPNHHALAERFGIYDRFFTNAEVSADGHNWSTAAYASDYVEKTVGSQYSDRRPYYDYEGTNRDRLTDDDVNSPSTGYLWNLAQRAGITFRNYGEFVVSARELAGGKEDVPESYRGVKPFLAAHTDSAFPGFDLDIPDQTRMDRWLDEFRAYERTGALPRLEIVRLPNDHTSGAAPGKPTPRAAFADNDLALGRMVDALSRSGFWRSTVVFVVEDDAQNGPDHVDSHRAPFFVISAYSHAGVVHRFVNTTDVVATIADILHLGSLSQFDYYGRPLRGLFATAPDLTPYAALLPITNLRERNPPRGPGAAASAHLDLRFEDQVNDDLFNHILWEALKGSDTPYPRTVHRGMGHGVLTY